MFDTPDDIYISMLMPRWMSPAGRIIEALISATDKACASRSADIAHAISAYHAEPEELNIELESFSIYYFSWHLKFLRAFHD